MVALYFLLFLFFINVNNSFKIINYIHRKSHNTLFMWCDYYIEKRLYINYNDNSSYCINLHRERAYYCDTDFYNVFNMDTNIENSNLTEWEKIKKYHLTPKSNPIVIYTNHTFTDTDVSNQYKGILEFEMTNIHYKTWNDIKDILVLEKRYERD